MFSLYPAWFIIAVNHKHRKVCFILNVLRCSVNIDLKRQYAYQIKKRIIVPTSERLTSLKFSGGATKTIMLMMHANHPSHTRMCARQRSTKSSSLIFMGRKQRKLTDPGQIVQLMRVDVKIMEMHICCHQAHYRLTTLKS